MGEQNVNTQVTNQQMRAFTRALLRDLEAMTQMIEEGRFETGVRRIGAEQEMFLVDESRQPTPMAMEILKKADDPRLTHELALYNLEANLTPQVFGGACLSTMEGEINEVVAKADKAARGLGAQVVLAGILPTLRTPHLTLDYMTPSPRYAQLNQVCSELNNSQFNIMIKGLDEIDITHDNVMLESANTSFQVHFQVGPEEFPRLYNLTQAVSAPVLAAAVNSPLLMGRRLWHETRVALFQHSVDGRSKVQRARSTPPRVSFGDDWIRRSVLEIYKDNIARFRILLATDREEDALQVLARGGIPGLKALGMHAGTVWRWNRPCYGSDGVVPHLRIENRILPSGPTVRDEVANAAFYFGLMIGLAEEYPDIHEVMEFDDAKNNFYAAARHGLKAQFTWINGQAHTAQTLILEHLLPLARQGLAARGIDSSDIDTYLGTLEERVESRQTGSQWALKSMAGMTQAPLDVRMRSLVSSLCEHQALSKAPEERKPIHKWPLARLHHSQDWFPSYRTVGQFMTTDLVTVRPSDPMELAVSMMDWQRVRHVPVEDDQGHLVGMVSFRSILRMVKRLFHHTPGESVDFTTEDAFEGVIVEEVMRPNPVHVSPDTPTNEALRIMREYRVSSLPVVDKGNQLVGLVTSYDFMEIASRLLEDYLEAEHMQRISATPAPVGHVAQEAPKTVMPSPPSPPRGALLPQFTPVDQDPARASAILPSMEMPALKFDDDE
ncbi:MAG: glutamate-cysteine ligase family protein [Bradymonadia bacterium]